MAVQDNDTQINTIMPGYVENHSLDFGPILRPCRQMSHLHKSGKHPHMTSWLHHHTGSSRWSPGYDEDQIALVISDLSTLWLRSL